GLQDRPPRARGLLAAGARRVRLGAVGRPLAGAAVDHDRRPLRHGHRTSPSKLTMPAPSAKIASPATMPPPINEVVLMSAGSSLPGSAGATARRAPRRTPS